MRSIASRKTRWAVPPVVAGMVALGAAIPTFSAGASMSELPPITPQQLLAEVAGAHVPAWHGSLTWTANLGLPDLGGLITGDGGQMPTASGFDPTTMLSGTHDIEVWTDGNQQRLALPGGMRETDLVRSGSQAWLYDSTSQHVTHYLPGSEAGAAPATPASQAAQPTLTPDQLASKLLAHLSASTTVNVTSGPEVADQPVYLLTLSPQAGSTAASQTTLDSVAISVDAANGLPLQVALYAKGTTAPVLQVGFSSVSFSAPSASNFQAPVGTSTSTVTVGGHDQAGKVGTPATGGTAPADAPAVSGPAWAWVISFGGAGTSPLNSALSNGEVQSVTTPVSGSFGTGRLLSSNVLNALILPSGRVVAGFVQPAVLESAAATS